MVDINPEGQKMAHCIWGGPSLMTSPQHVGKAEGSLCQLKNGVEDAGRATQMKASGTCEHGDSFHELMAAIRWVVDIINTITNQMQSLLFLRSQCELHTSSPNLFYYQYGQEALISRKTATLSSCHWCTVSSGSSGIIRVETGKEGKPFGMLLRFQHWDLRRVEHSGCWNIKKKKLWSR